MLGEFWIRNTRIGPDGRVNEVELAELKEQICESWNWISVESLNNLISDGNGVFNCTLVATKYSKGSEVKHYPRNFLKNYSSPVR